MIEYKFEYIQYLTHTRHSVIIHKRILEEETMKIKMGVITAITGKSGSGKTSIMYRLGLIENTLGDRYTFNGHQINLWDEEETGNYRGSKISFVYQDNNLFDHLTLKENYDLVTKMSNIQVDYIPYLNMVNLSEALLDQKVNLLSGGERQRATIALALLKQPELLLLDEPTSALDEMNKENVVKILKKAVSDTNMAVVIITHDLELAKLCDEIYEIKDKHLYLVKSTQEEVLKESKECRRSLIPSKYIKMDYFSNISLYSTLIIILCILLISGQLLIYSGSRFISDKKTSLGKLKDTTLFVVNNASNMVNVQDNMYNTPINNAAYEEIYSNEHIVGVMPVFKLKSTIINSTLGTEHFITIAQEHGYEPHEIWKMLKFDPKKESVVALCDRLNMPVDDFYELYNAYDENIIDSLYALGFRYQVYEQIVPDDHHTNEFIEWYQDTYLDGAYLLNDIYWITVPYSWLKDKLTFCTTEEGTERIFAVTESTREKLTSLIDWKNNKYAQFYLFSEVVGDLKAVHYTTYNGHTYPDKNPWYDDIERGGREFPAFLSRMYDEEIIINSFILLDNKDDLYSDINIPIYVSCEDAYKLLLSGEPAKYYHTNDYQKIYADTSSYIIEIDSIENIQSVVDAICKADPDIGIKYNNEQLTFYEKMIVDLSNFIYYFVALLVLLIIFIMIIIEYKFIQSKTYDIGLFKIYGLSEKKTANLFERMINSALFIIFIISSIVSGVIALLMHSNRFTGVIPIYVIIIGTAVSLIVTSVISHFYIRSVLHKLALNVLLKND